MDDYSITGCDIVTPRHIRANAALSVNNGIISGFTKNSKKNISLNNEYFLYPALINVHDHLRGNYLPKVGPKPGNYYLNWAYWDNDLKSSSVYEERSNISVEQMYFLGAYKNLFSGVVTVNDHFPHEFNDSYIDRLPIRVIRNYTLAHECSSFDLKWGDGIEIEHKRAVDKNWPFITHLEEGFDPESQEGIEVLERLGCLDSHDLLVHCIGFSDEDIEKARKANANISWCPASNIFMFNVTCKIKKMLESKINVSIGTDSTHTGSVNLLEEMRFARETYREMYGEDLSAEIITRMVTENPARAFKMDTEIGSIKEGYKADLLVLKAIKEDPYENLLAAKMDDIALLIMEGKPVLAQDRFNEWFSFNTNMYSSIKVGDKSMFVRGNPEKLLTEVRRAIGFDKKIDYLPFEPCCTSQGVI